MFKTSAAALGIRYRWYLRAVDLQRDSLIGICTALLFVFLLVQNVQAAAFQPFKGPRPIALMLDTDPWNMVIGSDTPSFVLYENGQVIYRKTAAGKSASFLSKQLTAEELQGLKSTLKAFGPFRKEQDSIILSDFSDQSETSVFLDVDNTRLVLSIYGMNVVDETGELRNHTILPARLRALHGFLSSINFKDVQEWQPEYIEVMAWDYENAPDASVSWPKQWPGLDSPTTIMRREGVYSIFMPGAQLKEVSAFLATRPEKGAIEIDGKKLVISVRRTFPSEPVWRKLFFE